MDIKKPKLNLGVKSAGLLIVAAIVLAFISPVMAESSTNTVGSLNSTQSPLGDSMLISLVLIVFGGVLGVLFSKWFKLSKVMAILIISVGSLLGIYKALMVILYNNSYELTYMLGSIIPVSFKIGPISMFFSTIVLLVSIMAAIYSYGYMDDKKRKIATGFHYLNFSVLVASMVGVTISNNSVIFLLFWELMTISSFLLVMFEGFKEEVRKSGHIYLIYAHAGGMFIFASFALAYMATGSIGFDQFSNIPDFLKIAVFLFGFVGFASKAGVFPFHSWLPYAHPVAPSHVSAVMSGVMIKMGIYGIINLIMLLGINNIYIGYMVLIFGILSGILGVAYALAQHDIKRLLAYSSIENIGIILIGLGIGLIGKYYHNETIALLGFAGALLHVLNHALFKSLLFMGAGAVIKSTGTHSLEGMGGLMKKMPTTATAFLIGSLAISGIPLFNGFVSELLIYMGGFNGLNSSVGLLAASTFGIIALTLIGGLATACFTKVLGISFLGAPKTKASANAKESPYMMRIPQILLALICIIMGIIPAFFVNSIVKIAQGSNLAEIVACPQLSVFPKLTEIYLILIALVLILVVWRTIYYRNKTVDGCTWDCGYSSPTVKMQYTASSYANPIVEFFKPFVIIKTHEKPVKGIFPSEAKYHSDSKDLAETVFELLLVKPVSTGLSVLRYIRDGNFNYYMGYVIIIISLLLSYVYLVGW
ncbi:proton-conducting transporter transmembrane domain-containing protein [Methanococcus aeolicus]|uniref:proton-conducting transporter transmembrane domain-containing protein n=1 Tax=Methanococcus aeolicus TaxID=42879 RepID=UPI0021C77B8C|nr:proton-conducting transporter membrane subunit [Methanococcus aeolicus]UXM84530.1 proton-conducting transporter membrane subunit [Methanococcus aeolicus]